MNDQNVAFLIAENLTVRQWLQYYKNVWMRNLSARVIDVETDTTLKSVNPEEQVQAEDGRAVTVKERLEMRKIVVQDAVDLIAGIDSLLALTDEDLAKKYGTDALKVAEDMLPKVEEKAPATDAPATPEVEPEKAPEAPAEAPAEATPEVAPETPADNQPSAEASI